ncbi:hypothetical protein GLP21_18510 [Photobacterium carnosum]|uniref:Uncharacterized protein n=1 Tax=Photobacterium carnosum TaxID=2023717 RepID=A0A2N4UWL9_9GAMM|nr:MULTISPECIES: hypothetical protein [Photobacterium]MCD9476342.1 hypothetical protein [Photobacterium phosphoreum]MCD9488891.1 hypothetical protein [Photobacterium iliopiscarium]MCD9508117.1 hypothetical protein [Photobacterium phosphoreum]MCD9539326.1 hypothetical protein [Photobacterium carnosum]MCD9542308.1 hypothetical protein [Photobacterium carnosum]
MNKLICVKKEAVIKQSEMKACLLNVRDFNEFVSIADDTQYDFLNGYIVDIKETYKRCTESVITLFTNLLCKRLNKSIDEVKAIDFIIVDLCF